ncbi:DivIVA domain-containing protein [Agromyces humatus]|uniref:Antigen 84 n=1 Tax=Agromyces humatus TaxID=279573 RepID=A0ABP4X3R3_9MICO|nr:hypothetical protein [Agromyces humatus]
MTQNGTEPESPADDSGTTPENALAAAVSHLPNTDDVNFTMKIRGGAYDRLEVDTFMGQLSEALAEAREAMTSAQQELAALRAENANGRTPVDEDEITSGAVGLLSQAQLIADKAVADAEQYARDLVLTARNQYREILQRAETSANQASATVAAGQGPPVPEIEYVRTYAQVAQIQLRSVLEALTEQVDRLGGLPQAAPEPPAAEDVPVEEPEWSPHTPESPPTQPS